MSVNPKVSFAVLLGFAGLAAALTSACDDDSSHRSRNGDAQAAGDGLATDVLPTDVLSNDTVDAGADDARETRSGGALLVTKSPAGNAPQTAWDGVLLYDIDVTGGAATPKADIDKSLVRDPAGLAFRSTASEILVGNRHGNTAADGVAGSISRFLYDPVTRAFTPHGTILGNGLAGVHQVFVAPDGEVFAANRDGGVSRFLFSADNVPAANGTISSGPTRGVATAPDGKRLYVTGASNTIRQFDLVTGQELTALSLPTVGNLHYMAIRQNQLYVAALDDNEVYRYDIATDDELIAAGAIAAPSPIAVAFSEDEQEMFVSGHRASSVVLRFGYVASGKAWTPSGQIDVGVSLGAIVMLPTR